VTNKFFTIGGINKMTQSPSTPEPRPAIPVMSFANGYAARLAGLSLREYLTDIPLNFRVQGLAQRLHGYQDTPTYGWADWGGWEFGGEIRWPESYLEGAPSTARSPVERPSDLDRLDAPDPETAGAGPLLTAFNQELARAGLPVKIRAGSPTSVAAGMIGQERLLRWFLREPGAVETAFRMAVDFILGSAARTVARFGTRASASLSAPLDANTLISPEIFQRFAVPALERIIEGLAGLGVTALKVHLCGDHRRNLELWAGLAWPEETFFSIGSEVDLETAAEAFGHRHRIGGNVRTDLLAGGRYEEVYREARRCLEIGFRLPGGYSLMPACEMPVTAPPLNVQALVDAANDFNREKGLPRIFHEERQRGR